MTRPILRVVLSATPHEKATRASGISIEDLY